MQSRRKLQLSVISPPGLPVAGVTGARFHVNNSLVMFCSFAANSHEEVWKLTHIVLKIPQ